MNKIIVINGPNLNMLGVREKNIYGNKSLSSIEEECKELCRLNNFLIDFFQFNSESEIIEKIQEIRDSYNALIINAAAFTHTSIAIHDSLKLLDLPIIEVHLSNLSKREDFRQKSLISPLSLGVIFGFGSDVYKIAIYSLKLFWSKNEN